MVCLYPEGTKAPTSTHQHEIDAIIRITNLNNVEKDKQMTNRSLDYLFHLQRNKRKTYYLSLHVQLYKTLRFHNFTQIIEKWGKKY